MANYYGVSVQLSTVQGTSGSVDRFIGIYGGLFPQELFYTGIRKDQGPWLRQRAAVRANVLWDNGTVRYGPQTEIRYTWDRGIWTPKPFRKYPTDYSTLEKLVKYLQKKTRGIVVANIQHATPGRAVSVRFFDLIGLSKIPMEFEAYDNRMEDLETQLSQLWNTAKS